MPKHRAIAEEEPGRILAAMADLNAHKQPTSPLGCTPTSLHSLCCTGKWSNSLFANG
jgi:hypothetical protein